MIHGPNIPGPYAILLFTTSDFASITSHIHNWVLYLLWLHLFILSGVISPLISSSILDTYRSGGGGGAVFPCGSAGKESACNAGDMGSIPELGRSPGKRNIYLLQYYGLENSMDCIVHGVAKSRTQCGPQ